MVRTETLHVRFARGSNSSHRNSRVRHHLSKGYPRGVVPSTWVGQLLSRP